MTKQRGARKPFVQTVIISHRKITHCQVLIWTRFHHVEERRLESSTHFLQRYSFPHGSKSLSELFNFVSRWICWYWNVQQRILRHTVHSLGPYCVEYCSIVFGVHILLLVGNVDTINKLEENTVQQVVFRCNRNKHWVNQTDFVPTGNFFMNLESFSVGYIFYPIKLYLLSLNSSASNNPQCSKQVLVLIHKILRSWYRFE